MANFSTKNRNWMLWYEVDNIAARVMQNIHSDTAARITSLTDKDRVRGLVYRTVAVEATTNGWDENERRAAIAILREYFDGNRATIDHVTVGAEEKFPGLPYAVGEVFDEVMGYDPELAQRLNLPGLHRHRSAYRMTNTA